MNRHSVIARYPLLALMGFWLLLVGCYGDRPATGIETVITDAISAGEIQSGEISQGEVVAPASCTSCHGQPPEDNGHIKHHTSPTYHVTSDCATCHPVPTLPQHGGLHGDGNVDMDFSASWLATEGFGRVPEWTGSSCKNTYCHGSSLTGGTYLEPVWTQQHTALPCEACHGNPPASSFHPDDNDCAACHDVYNPDGSLNANHLDGFLD